MTAMPSETCSAPASSGSSRSRRRRLRTSWVTGLLITAALVTGCSANSSSDRDDAAASMAEMGSGSDAGADSGGDSGGDARAYQDTAGSSERAPASTIAPVNVTSEQLARRASMALQVKSIAEAAARVRTIAATSEGLILSENIGGSATENSVEEDRVSATTYGEIAISVPSARLDQTLDDLAGLGSLIRRNASTENVAQQVVDTDTRLKTMQASVDRIRALMAQTEDIEQIVRLESELSSRTAELESLKAQLAGLKNSVARSPIQISLTTDSGVIQDDPSTGFLAGLAAGWGAFTGSVVVLLTVVGALLPFGFLLALVLVPLWIGLKRRRRVAPAGAQASA